VIRESFCTICLYNTSKTKPTIHQEQEWKERASKLTSPNLKLIEPYLAELDAHLTLRSYIVGYTLSRADLWVWGVLRGNGSAKAYVKQGLMVNLTRWSNFIEESNPWIADVILSSSAAKLSVKETKADDGASYDIGLQDTEKGGSNQDGCRTARFHAGGNAEECQGFHGGGKEGLRAVE